MKNNWINVRDNRPKDEQRVLLYVKNIEYNSDLISVATYGLEFSSFDDSYVGCFYVYTRRMVIAERGEKFYIDVRQMVITERGEKFYIVRDFFEDFGEADVYWMELPEPPKVGD